MTPVRPHRYLCYGCREVSVFRLKGEPRKSWCLTCRKCGRYHRHALLKRRAYSEGGS